jgi:hypothetical protein
VWYRLLGSLKDTLLELIFDSIKPPFVNISKTIEQLLSKEKQVFLNIRLGLVQHVNYRGRPIDD